ncbi:hypothetical protein EG329_008023 [Mollisiaceae sp. DMI_Dod_QoI]|nr:hypothetical protein EG329_008023 [Helotiales sp. DMI_Dod_QoI]
MEPVNAVHLLTKHTLLKNNSTKFHRQARDIVPVSGHYLTDRKSDGLLDQLFDVIHAWPLFRVVIDEFDNFRAEFHSDESVREDVVELVPIFLNNGGRSAGSGRENSASEWPVSHDKVLDVLLKFGDEKEIVIDFAATSMADV